MSNFTSILANNTHIAAEFGRTGRMVNPQSKGFAPKPKSQETVQKERIEMRHNSRRNVCGECFTTKSKTGVCNCM